LEDQQDGRGGVASVLETAVPSARVPQKPRPDAEGPGVSVRTTGTTGVGVTPAGVRRVGGLVDFFSP
jgi:hypothetical protein